MKENFIARIVEITESEGNVTLIGFSEDDDTYVNNLIVSYSPDLTEQDKKFGWSRYYIEIGIDGTGGYNCVNSINLSQDRLKIEFKHTHEKTFGLREVQIEFKISSEKYAELKDKLRTAFFDDPTIRLNI